MIVPYLILFGVNFIVLSIFFSIIAYSFHMKHRDVKVSLQLKFRKEEERLEALTGELAKIAHTVTKKLDAKEQTIRVLLEKAEFYETMLQTQGAPTAETARQVHTGRSASPSQMNTLCQEDEKYKDIYYFADNGMSVSDIARKTCKSKGEINLILRLRNAQSATT